MIAYILSLRFKKAYKMKTLFLFVLFLSPFFCQAQDAPAVQYKDAQSRLDDDFIKRSKTQLIEVTGSRFLYDDYLPGELTMRNGRKYGNDLRYKFDEYHNTVQVEMPDGKELVLEPNDIIIFKLHAKNDTLVFFKSVLPKSKSIERLCLILYASEQYKLIKLPSKRVKKTQSNALSSYKEAAEFEDDSHYFLKISTGDFNEIRLTKKALTKAFPTQKATLKQFFDTPQYKELNDWNIAEVLKKIDN